MDLKDFTKKVIIEVMSAVSDVDKSSGRSVWLNSSKDGKRTIEFDVAVTVEEASEKAASGNIKVLGMFGIDGEFTKEVVGSATSRVQFGVDIDRWSKADMAGQL